MELFNIFCDSLLDDEELGEFIEYGKVRIEKAPTLSSIANVPIFRLTDEQKDLLRTKN